MTATAAEQHGLAPSGGHARRWLILGVICLAQLTVLLDNTVLNVAIPSLTARAPRVHRRRPVDDQRLLARPVRAAAHRGQLRRPLRPQEDAGRGARAVRRRLARRPDSRSPPGSSSPPARGWASAARC